ncbi:metallophosphoesterase family protein [Candidatus Nanohalobium constans]|uniref:Putative phosphoesterase, Icc family n=1 Tax=Candidatus Nanohalobium constans TaxID=2565781 RepID=A0A5Q0UGV8_9ARCH|nr:metallophosphoesterase [Candidatus Nanohalobium constans]QGA80440.1 putative phosphoesterase, Icc family [Candidatus Nanohalobium constans]
MTLKILVTSDFHKKEDLKEAAIEEANNGDYDLFVNLGDYMDEDYAEELFDEIEVAGVGSTGNRDMMFSSEFLDGPVPVYNFLEADIDDEYKLILIGGDFPEDVKEQVEDLVEDYDNDKVIIGSHYPPHKVGDRVHSGKRIGFEQFREIIIKHKPALWMNGHVHEDFGERQLMGTPVLNAAADETGKAFSVTIGDEGGVEEIEEITLVE